MLNKKTKVLSPVGTYEAFIAALKAGADEVYFGSEKFNARRFAKGITDDEIKSMIELAKLYDIKLCMTVNIILDDKEVVDALFLIEEYRNMGVDAFIITDLGLISLVKKYLPDVEVHASTQLNIANLASLDWAIEHGFQRAVIAREKDYRFLEKASEKDIELEAFVHGALCYAVSGQCLMSSLIGERSGNRGTCAQPCRKMYDVYSEGKLLREKIYAISEYDLNTLDSIDKLVGRVDSLKIEGRMKNPSYVYLITKLYKDKILGVENTHRPDEVFNRGFTKGHILKDGMDKMLVKEKKHFEGGFELEDFSFTKKDISFDLKAKIGEKIILTLNYMDEEHIKESEYIVQKAKTASIDREKIIDPIIKTGKDFLNVREVRLDVDEDAFIPVKELKSLRRELIDELLKKDFKGVNINTKKKDILAPYDNKKNNKQKIILRASSYKDLNGIDINKADTLSLYLNKDNINFLSKININKEVYTSNAASDEDLDEYYDLINEYGKNIDSIEISELGAYQKLKDFNKKIYASYMMNIFNSEAAKYMSESHFSGFTYSLEMSLAQMEKIMNYGLETRLFTYGYPVVMMSKACPLANIRTDCDQRCETCPINKANELVYEDKERFIFTRENNYTKIYNSQKIFMLDKMDDVKKLGATSIIIDLDNENDKKKINEYIDRINNGDGIDAIESFTRAHYYKKVL